MRVTTWNINSLRARLARLPEILGRNRPDVLCLQETKVRDEDFPREAFAQLGYGLAVFGQKTYNGVAIASRHPIELVDKDFPVRGDGQARGLAVRTGGLLVVDVYVVNGRKVGDPAYDYKLYWLDRLRSWLDECASPEEPLVLCGDFNIAPEDRDVHDPEAWREKVLCSTPERERFRKLLDWGLTDAFRAFNEDAGRYVHTWWDYRGRAFQRGLGLRIDHHLVTRPVLDRATGVLIDRDARKGQRPSDHAPVTLFLDEPAVLGDADRV